MTLIKLINMFANDLKITNMISFEPKLANSNPIHLLNLITILQWYTEINRKQMSYLAYPGLPIEYLQEKSCCSLQGVFDKIPFFRGLFSY